MSYILSLHTGEGWETKAVTAPRNSFSWIGVRTGKILWMISRRTLCLASSLETQKNNVQKHVCRTSKDSDVFFTLTPTVKPNLFQTVWSKEEKQVNKKMDIQIVQDLMVGTYLWPINWMNPVVWSCRKISGMTSARLSTHSKQLVFKIPCNFGRRENTWLRNLKNLKWSWKITYKPGHTCCIYLWSNLYYRGKVSNIKQCHKLTCPWMEESALIFCLSKLWTCHPCLFSSNLLHYLQQDWAALDEAETRIEK